MPMTQAQEDALSNARAKGKQDRAIPMLINVRDGRLLPNTAKLRAHMDYRPYTGSLKASLEERMAFASSLLRGGPARRVVDSSAAAVDKPFDLAKASKDELIAFAAEEYQIVLDAKLKPAEMRAVIQQAYTERTAPAGEDLS